MKDGMDQTTPQTELDEKALLTGMIEEHAQRISGDPLLRALARNQAVLLHLQTVLTASHHPEAAMSEEKLAEGTDAALRMFARDRAVAEVEDAKRRFAARLAAADINAARVAAAATDDAARLEAAKAKLPDPPAAPTNVAPPEAVPVMPPLSAPPVPAAAATTPEVPSAKAAASKTPASR